VPSRFCRDLLRVTLFPLVSRAEKKPARPAGLYAALSNLSSSASGSWLPLLDFILPETPPTLYSSIVERVHKWPLTPRC
jgi:hypothetical protein